MDMYNGEIISYSISERPTAKNIMDALKEAIKVTAIEELSILIRMGLSDEVIYKKIKRGRYIPKHV